MRHIRSVVAVALLCLVGSFVPTVVGAAVQELTSPRGQTIVLERNEGKLIRISQPASTVFLANPGIATVTVKSPRLIHLFGKTPGETTLYALDDEDRVVLNTTIQVDHNLSRLRSSVRELLPDSDITVDSVEGSIVLDGTVQTAMAAENVRRLAARFIGEGEEVINRLQVVAPNQVNLRVRVAEVSRTVLRQLGINWSAVASTGAFQFGLVTKGYASSLANVGSTLQTSHTGFLNFASENLSFETLLDALAEEGLVSLLAEPNLTALSGETASFLSGGEFPVPVSQNADEGGISVGVEFKQFGVSLSFTPTVLGERRIGLRVRPEVSELSNEGAVRLGNFVIPSVATRKAETTVELASGQTFAIAGLISNNTRQESERVPGLSDIPVLGELFRSDRFSRDESELVILVTPYIVQPVSDQRLTDPTEAVTGAEGSSRFAERYHYGLAGPAGFIVE